MTAEGAYLLRRHPQADSFRKAWAAALALGVQRLADVAMERALYGVEVPVYHFGAVVGTRRVFNDRLLMFLLRNRAPKRFAADAATRAMLARHKKEWRAEWEAEAEARSAAEAEAAVATLTAKLELMANRAVALTDTPPSPDEEPDPAPDHAAERPPWVKPPTPLLPLPQPYDDPQTDNERTIAAWMRHVETGRIGWKVNEEARLTAEALEGLRAVEEGEEGAKEGEG
jgi:hypothetical protein